VILGILMLMPTMTIIMNPIVSVAMISIVILPPQWKTWRKKWEASSKSMTIATISECISELKQWKTKEKLKVSPKKTIR
jgi:hypothetical protein